MVASLQIPSKVWIEMHENEFDTPSSCDVLVRMDDTSLYTAHFVTLAYLRRQMDLSYAVTSQIDETPAVRYAALETPHILVDDLARDTIEDTIDNLIALDIFENLFTLVAASVESQSTALRTPGGVGTRATQELAAVVLSDVLVIEGDD